MDQSWRKLVDAYYTIFTGGQPHLFSANFSWIAKKVIIYGRMRKPMILMKISEVASEESITAIAMLCAILEMEGENVAVDKSLIAFQYLFHKIPAGVDVSAHLRTSALPASPFVAFQHVAGGKVKYFVHDRGCMGDITDECDHGGDAIDILFKYYLGNSIPFPPALAAFYDFVYFYVACASPTQGFLCPSDVSKKVHDMLKKTSVQSIFKTLNL